MSELPQSLPYGLLSKEQLEAALQTKHSVCDYLDHAHALCSQVRMSQEGERSFQNRRGPAKELCDEMVPIGYLCKYFLSRWPESGVQLVLGSQTFDAVVSHPEGLDELPSYIEVTGLDLTGSHMLRQALAAAGSAVEKFSECERLAEASERFGAPSKTRAASPIHQAP